jgi:two-component system NtrC family sensor kinase
MVCTDKDGGFTPDDGATLSRVANRIGLVFYKAQHQEEILNTKRFYQDLVSKAGRAIVTIRDGKISSWNEVAASIFGISASEAAGKEISLILPEDAEERMTRVIEEGGIVSFETKGKRKDDAELDVCVTLSRMTDEAELVGIIADLTERKRLQRQILQSEKLAAVGELIAGVAHELNNPLAAVIGYSELLREQTDLGQAVQEDLGMIHVSAERCKEIVEKLLRFARKETTQFLTMNLNQVLRDTVALRQHEMELRNVEIRVEEKASLPAMFGNPGQLQQVFLNLLNNAFDAIQEAGRSGQIRITVEQQQEMAVVKFQDTGPGIPEGKLSRIFDPFFTTKQTGRGTGLGLSIAYRIVENHGGHIEVDSADGKGSTFQVRLPMNIAAALPEGDGMIIPGEVEDLLRDRDILIVEDEPAVHRMMERALGDRGASIRCAECAEDALVLAEERTPDLVIADVIMPGPMDGLDFCEEVLRRWPHLNGRIIVTTGETVNPAGHRPIQGITDAFLAKPFSLADLLEAVQDTLAGQPA